VSGYCRRAPARTPATVFRHAFATGPGHADPLAAQRHVRTRHTVDADPPPASRRHAAAAHARRERLGVNELRALTIKEESALAAA